MEAGTTVGITGRNSVIIIAGNVTVKPDRRDEWLQVAMAMSRASQAEDGCVTYRFYQDLEDPNLMLLFEVWESEEALEAHFKTDHIAEYRSKIPELIAGPSKLNRYEVSSARPL
jgi:quinol monooxygenase YgiN